MAKGPVDPFKIDRPLAFSGCRIGVTGSDITEFGNTEEQPGLPFFPDLEHTAP
jgi:hypothetical protein